MKWAKLFVCATLLLAAPAWVAASEDDLDAELEIDVEDELDAEDDTTAHLVVRKVRCAPRPAPAADARWPSGSPPRTRGRRWWWASRCP